MKETRPRTNFLGVGGWAWAGKYALERYLYLLHRITGLGILLFGIIHLITTTFFRIRGEDVWEATMTLLSNPWFKTGEYLVVIAFLYHASNGLRLTLQELGFTLGRPTPPIYPYQDALRKKRSRVVAMLVTTVVLALVFLYDFIIGGW